MKITRTAVLMLGLSVAACGGSSGDDDDGDDAPPVDASTVDTPEGPQTIRVTDDITEDTTWESENTYVLPRLNYVFVQPGATLTIEPGTVIEGEQGSVLVITRGAKIEAVGTPDAPILFTSSQDECAKTSGYWGGLLVLGAAPINVNSGTSDEAIFEAFTSAIEEGKFGGTDAADDSGTLKYVRVEFGGFNYLSDREFNNITFCGVGSGTEVDYVQSHNGKDDGLELFGGTVNIKHVVISQNQDDGLDTDNGWQGKGQFIIVQHVDPDSAADASNGYESDNHSTGFTLTPRTLPVLYNVTMLGKEDNNVGNGSFATVLRRGTGGHYYNHIIMGFSKGIEARDLATKDQIDGNNLFFKNSIFFHNDALGDDDNWPAAQASNDIDEETYWGVAVAANANREEDPGLESSAFSLTAPDFKPRAQAAALTGGATPPDDGFFDPAATFVGAIGTEDWTAGWTAYPQN